jgi:hypothetical protein
MFTGLPQANYSQISIWFNIHSLLESLTESEIARLSVGGSSPVVGVGSQLS